MRKSNLVRLVTILLISVMVMLFATTVNAADDGFNVLTLNNTNTNNTNTNTANTNTNTNNTNVNTNKNNTNTNNSSIYSNTDLPKTGIEDSIPVAILAVVFGISAVYAYKKIREYKNI